MSNSPNQPTWSVDGQHRWLLYVLDQNGHVVDIPQTDVESVEVEDILNGGSGQGTIVFRRDYNNIGALAYGYKCLLFFWLGSNDINRSSSTQPVTYLQAQADP